MLNQIILVGRLNKVECNEENDTVNIFLAVSRSYKNKNGEYDIDLIPCSLLGSVAQSVKEYCEVNDLIGIKGRLQIKCDSIELVAEKVTFLQQNS